MSTGYTDQIKKGIGFEKFVMSCARAFGALAMMRDDSFDAKIPKFKPSDYHKKELSSASRKLGAIKKMRLGKILEISEAEAASELRRTKKRRAKMRKEIDETEKKYRDMLDKVLAWKPPTKDHQGLKEFMISQIKGSINFDCDKSYINDPELKTPEQHLYDKLLSLKRDVEYHSKEWEEDVERAKNNNAWVKNLVKSLGITREAAGLVVKKKVKTVKAKKAKSAPSKKTSRKSTKKSKR